MIKAKRKSFLRWRLAGLTIPLTILLTCLELCAPLPQVRPQAEQDASAGAQLPSESFGSLPAEASGQNFSALNGQREENRSTLSEGDLESLVSQLLYNHETPPSSYVYRNSSYELDDRNKEIVDYNTNYLDSLHFIETERLASSPEVARASTDALLRKHHNNEEMYEYLLELSQKYPEVCHLYSIGESAQKRKLWVLVMSEEPTVRKADKVEFRYVANIHGNEVVGRELLLALARLLAENYRAAKDELSGPNERVPSGPKFVRKLLKQTRIHLMPSANPDGYANAKESCVYERIGKRGRINEHNVDLNRNFPDRVLGNKEDPATQPEVHALMEWTRSIPFVLAANIHGGALVVSYGYDGNSRGDNAPEYAAAPDDDLLRHVSSVYARNHPLMARSELCYDACADYHPEIFPDGTTNGAQWYPLYGSLQDWTYENSNALEVTLEVGCNQFPKAEELHKYWALNKRSLLVYIREAHRGVRGVVRDAVSKQPLANVSVRVQNRQHDVKTSPLGDYHKLLLEGNYEISFERSGYASKRMFVTVSNGMAAIHNIDLEPEERLNGHGGSEAPIEAPTSGTQGANAATEEKHHSLLVATLTMTVVITLILLAMIGAYVIQKRRFTRSQSMSMELQPPRESSTGSNPRSQQQLKPPPALGSSTNTHISA